MPIERGVEDFNHAIHTQFGDPMLAIPSGESHTWWETRAKKLTGLRPVVSLKLTAEQAEREAVTFKRAVFTMLEPHLTGREHLLEVGTGVGRFTGDLADRVNHVTSFDFSKSMLHRAQTAIQNPNVTFVYADATQLPFPDEKFEGVFETYVLNHIISETDFQKAIKELKRTLKKGGFMFLAGSLSTGARSQVHAQRVARPIEDYEEVLAPLKIVETRFHQATEHDGQTTMMLVR